MPAIHLWPQGDRPREKLLQHGASALTNSELLAILLRTDMAGISVITILASVATFAVGFALAAWLAKGSAEENPLSSTGDDGATDTGKPDHTPKS